MFTAKPEDGVVGLLARVKALAKPQQLLAEEGFTVCISARTEEKLIADAKDFSGAGEVIPYPLDVTDREANAGWFSRLSGKRVELPLHCLTPVLFKPVTGEDLNYEGFDFTNTINLDGVINGLVPVVEAMKEAGQGQIAIMSSVAGYGGLPKNTTYGLTKAALINAAESLEI